MDLKKIIGDAVALDSSVEQNRTAEQCWRIYDSAYPTVSPCLPNTDRLSVEKELMEGTERDLKSRVDSQAAGAFIRAWPKGNKEEAAVARIGPVPGVSQSSVCQF